MMASLSFGQQRLWFMAQLDPVSSVYNTLTRVSLPDRVDLDAFQWAVDSMVERHDEFADHVCRDETESRSLGSTRTSGWS